MNDTRILVAHSFQDSSWTDPALGSGRYLHMDLSREQDNENWGEVSTIDWIKDRPQEIEDAVFLGTAQYRRRLVERDITEKQALVHYEDFGQNLYLDWNIKHSTAYLQDFLDRTRRSDPAFADGFLEWAQTSTRCPAWNLFILPRHKFEEWACFVNKIRRRISSMRKVDYGFYGKDIWTDRHQRRQPAFLIRLLTGYWLEKISGLELIDAPVIQTNEYSPYQPRRKSCVVAIQREEANLDEWARWHLDVCGFDSIFLFNDRCPEHVFPEKLKDRVFQTEALDDGVNGGKQITSYNAWLYSAEAKEYDIAAFIDLDEYVNLHGQTVEEYMYGKDSPAVGLNWVFYGSKILGDWPADSLAKRFRHRARKPDGHIKPILALDKIRQFYGLIFYFDSPYCLGARDGAGTTAIVPALLENGVEVEADYAEMTFDPADTPYLAHYYAKTEEEFRRKVEKGRVDVPQCSVQQFSMLGGETLDDLRREYDRSEVYDDEIARKLW